MAALVVAMLDGASLPVSSPSRAVLLVALTAGAAALALFTATRSRRAGTGTGRGLGEELLSALLDRAREGGFRQVSLSVEGDNPAIRLYEQHGFAEVGRQDGALVMLAEL